MVELITYKYSQSFVKTFPSWICGARGWRTLSNLESDCWRRYHHRGWKHIWCDNVSMHRMCWMGSVILGSRKEQSEKDRRVVLLVLFVGFFREVFLFVCFYYKLSDPVANEDLIQFLLRANWPTALWPGEWGTDAQVIKAEVTQVGRARSWICLQSLCPALGPTMWQTICGLLTCCELKRSRNQINYFNPYLTVKKKKSKVYH